MNGVRVGLHLASCAGRTPLDHQSGKWTGRSKSKKGDRHLATITGETASAVGKTATREGPPPPRQGQGPGRRQHPAEGLPQTAVPPGMRYEDLSLDYYERQRDIRRQIAHHVDKLGALGFRSDTMPHPWTRAGTIRISEHGTGCGPGAAVRLVRGDSPAGSLVAGATARGQRRRDSPGGHRLGAAGYGHRPARRAAGRPGRDRARLAAAPARPRRADAHGSHGHVRAPHRRP